MRTKLANTFGLALLLASLTCGSSLVYAFSEDEATSSLQTPLPDDFAAPSSIRFVDAVQVEITQTVTIAIPGEGADSEAAMTVGSLAEPAAAEPLVDASAAPADQPADAIV